MKRLKNHLSTNFFTILLVGILCTIGFAGVLSCSDSDNDWDQTPRAIRQFISEYFPGQEISDYTENEGVIHVKLKNSAALNFDETSQNWISVNGCGDTLPQQFLFDRMPPALYEYLQETSAVNGVYRVTRDMKTRIYSVALLDCTVEFDAETSKVTVQ